MKTPITYYGGKQRMLEHILPLIPDHKKYVEPFAGGAAVFFAKRPSAVEVLNDINGNLANFYRVMKLDFEALHRLIDATLHDEHTYKRARAIYRGKVAATELERAWAVWVACRLSFGSKFFSGFRFSAVNNPPEFHTTHAKKKEFLETAGRLDKVAIVEKDAVDIILKFNQPDSFVYADPPYLNANQGHYDGYTRRDFIKLLLALKNFKGNFLLSSYDGDLLQWFAKRYNWNQKYIGKCLIVNTDKRQKIEVLTWNYQKELTLF